MVYVVMTYDIILIDEPSDGINSKFELWRYMLETKGFGLTWTDHVKYNFINAKRKLLRYVGQVLVDKRHYILYLFNRNE